VYRTYITVRGWSPHDEAVIDEALSCARRSNPAVERTVFDFLRSVLLPEGPGREAELQFAMKLQQYTAPVQAKGVEDTAFYRYNTLLALNEVGGDPSRAGRTPAQVHAALAARAARAPFSMTATSTHDTKLGEDTRARIAAISERPEEWHRLTGRWSRLARAAKTTAYGERLPDRNDEYRFYQVLAGIWPADAIGAPKVAIVNEAFAKKFNLGRDAVGKRMGENQGSSSKLDIEIVGLVKDAKYSEVKGQIPPVFFRPYRQDDSVGQLTFYVRTALDSREILPGIPQAVKALDPNLPVENFRTMPQQVRDNVFLDRFISVLSVSFAVLATLLAAVGLYGVLAYTVAQRTREIGLRMALGAPPARVRRMVLKQVAVMTAVGSFIGLTAALWLGPMAESQLFELKGRDPLVFISSAVVLAAIALLAGFIPAHPASRVERGLQRVGADRDDFAHRGRRTGGRRYAAPSHRWA